MSEVKYRSDIKDEIKRIIYAGVIDYPSVLKTLGSADPALVRELFDECKTIISPTLVSDHDVLKARRLAATLPLKLPVPNPMTSQWWFTLDSVTLLSERVRKYVGDCPAAFLGAPTVAYHYSHSYNSRITVLDADPDVINSLELASNSSKCTYDAVLPIPAEYKALHSIALVDPPWYDTEIRLFIARARELLLNDGFIICVLPSRLTRPGIIAERNRLLNDLISSRFEIVALDSDCIEYSVPEFEKRAYSHIPEFNGMSWRRGDLLMLRTSVESILSFELLKRFDIEIFSRTPSRQRYFLSPERADSGLSDFVVPVTGFETTVSTRALSLDNIAIWGSNKKGAKLRDARVGREILNCWQRGFSFENTVIELKSINMGVDDKQIKDFADALDLWHDEDQPTHRRTPGELEDYRNKFISKLASEPSARQYEFESDGFRLGFQRDRDRILWSHALKNLANKTQLFSIKTDAHLRSRLAHTIEVMQLASTIAKAFGLDPELTEACALAHDVGHTPFGHAGEHALDAVLNDIEKRLRGFNHYEHGVDVVRWLEDAYQSPGIGGFPGLNLTFETIESIFKHTYHRGNQPLGQKWLEARTKYKDLQNSGSCHMEGQAIRIADKTSYVISDIEDGIRNGILNYSSLMKCKFFHRPPIDLVPASKESLYERFISQRRSILKVIMEDVLSATDKKTSRFKQSSDIRAEESYVVTYSEVLNGEMTEIWRELQAGILHKDPSVITANNRAATIVSDLLILYAVAPHLVDTRFRNMYSRLERTDYLKWYTDLVGSEIGIASRRISRIAYEYAISTKLNRQSDNWMIPTCDIIQAKDYVASLTDTQAIIEHRKHCGTLWESII